MPCGYVYFRRQRARERRQSVSLHIFCVRLPQVCSFYYTGQCEGLYKRNEQQVRLSRFLFFYNLTPTRRVRRRRQFMTGNSQWKNVIHRYGIGDRLYQDRSLEVDSSIKNPDDALDDVKPDDVILDHFESAPLTYIFVNNKTILSVHRGNE